MGKLLFANPRQFAAASRMNIRMRFCCPRCGGSSFGSRGQPDAQLTRSCHGDDAGDGRTGCRFSWREADDYRYFYGMTES